MIADVNDSATDGSVLSRLLPGSGSIGMVLGSRLKTIPPIFYALARLRQSHKKRLVTHDTDIVIEGIARSGNHFATFAFMQAQRRPLKVAHHFHAPAQLILGARWGIPGLVLIREPLEQAASFSVYLSSHDDHALEPVTMLELYRMFYGSLVPYKNRLVAADFREVTSDFGKTIARLNAKYGTNFDIFNHTRENVARVEQTIRAEHASHMDGKTERDPLPNEQKNLQKKQLLERLESEVALLRDCRALYAEFVGPSV